MKLTLKDLLAKGTICKYELSQYSQLFVLGSL